MSTGQSVEAGQRWVQLTYTVVDSTRGDGYAGSGGGWQVKQASASLRPDEQELMLRATASVLLPPKGLPRFPSEAEITELPVRLRYTADAGRGVWCQSAPAGPDATGRPDNVFNHAVLDRAPAQRTGPEVLRPIQAWRAPGWLRPFGAAATRAAQFDVEVPLRGTYVTRERVVAFLLDPDVYRFDTFALLLDAAATARPVVLAARSVDEAALWIGALSFFMSPQRCAELSFSTYERAAELIAKTPSERAATAVTSVPWEDLDAIADLVPAADGAILVVDPDGEVVTRTRDGLEYRMTQLDQRVAVSEWSRLAADVCCEPAAAVVRVLERLDEVSQGLRGDEVPVWPLAAAVATDQRDFPLAARAAVSLALSAVPPDLELSAPLGPLLVHLSNDHAISAAAAWDRVEALALAPAPNPAMVRMAVETYVRQAAADDNWLLARTRPPLPAPSPVIRFGPDDSTRIRPIIESMLARLADAAARQLPAPTRCLHLLRGLDFAVRVESLVGLMALDAMPEIDALAQEAAELLVGPASAAIAAGAVEVDELMLKRWLCRALAGTLSPERLPGTRLPPEITRLLSRAYPVDELIAATAAKDVEKDLAQVEVVVALGTGLLPDGERLRPLAAALRLRWASAQDGEPTPEEVGELLDSVSTGRPFNVHELLRIVELVGFDRDHLLVEPCLARLADWLEDAGAPALAHRLLRIPPRGFGNTERELLGLVADGLADRTGLRTEGIRWNAGILFARADRLWSRLAPEQRTAIAPWVTVCAFESAIALNLSPRTDVGKPLVRGSAGYPLTTSWQEAVGAALSPALPLLATRLVVKDGNEPLWYWLAVAWARVLIGRPVEAHGWRGEPDLRKLPVDEVLGHVLSRVSEPVRDELERALRVAESEHSYDDDGLRARTLQRLLATAPAAAVRESSEARAKPFRVSLPGAKRKRGPEG
ncbi:MAG TPA: hypothetical protein VLL08_05905 [Kineosporiaceae bacterium]|nr:hypothetical protein [Kineosporiaceae bacterium]